MTSHEQKGLRRKCTLRILSEFRSIASGRAIFQRMKFAKQSVTIARRRIITETPIVKDRLFKNGFAIELFRIAENDPQAAKTLASEPLVRRETALLMVQQGIEKAFNFVLCSDEIPRPRTHELSLIVDGVNASSTKLPALIANTDFDELTPFATMQ